MIILGTPIEKNRAIDLLQAVLQTMIFNGITKENQAQIMSHLEWMRRRTEDMNLSCRLETFPETMKTTIFIETSFKAKVQA